MADDPTCSNCGQPRSHHTKVDYLCPSDFNDGEDDMGFSTMPSLRIDPFADARLGKSLFEMRPEDWVDRH